MKTKFFTFLLFIIFIIMVTGAGAFDGGVIKWRQPPDEGHGVNILSIEDKPRPIVADDWLCKDTKPVTDVHFWGSYLEWMVTSQDVPNKTPGVNGFVIRIYEDIPASPGGVSYSRPGKLLYEKVVTVFTETLWGSYARPDKTYEHKYYYSLDLPEPFNQVEGTIYWISISAIMPDNYINTWGWETSIIHWNDNACFYNFPGESWIELTPLSSMLPQWYQSYSETVDMAFELSVPYEPPPPLEPVKWQQRPDMVQGVNIVSSPGSNTVADDWLCLDGSPVTNLHFWGSYPGWMENKPEPPGPPPGVKSFRIQVYSDAPVLTSAGFSHPDKLLYEVWVDDFTETYVRSIPMPWGTTKLYEHKYRYDLDLPRIFWQRRNRIYWLNISAVTYHQAPEMKWKQRPDEVCGVNIKSMEVEPIVADDWKCNDPRPVKDVHFWGSYIGWKKTNHGPPPEVPEDIDVDVFIIRFYSDIPADPPGISFSHPGDKLYEVRILKGDFTEKYLKSILLPDGSYEHKFYYSLDLPEPFHQQEGKIYWISISAINDSTTIIRYPWGWETCDPIDHWNDNACLFWVYNNYWDVIRPDGWPMPSWYKECYNLPHVDMAFALSVDRDYLWGWESSMDRWNDFAVEGWYKDPDTWLWSMLAHPWAPRHIDMSFELTTCEGPIKWLQFPDMAKGLNIISLPTDPVAADDWLCTNGKPIKEVHFWGSYLKPDGIHWEQDNPGPPNSLLPNTPGLNGFKLSFHKDVPAGQDIEMPWSHPGELIREENFGFNEVQERYWDSVPHTNPITGNIWWEHKFYYIIRLKTPFYQEKGKIYWLDIGAIPLSGTNWLWGWETSKDHWNDNAVLGWNDGMWWENISGTSDSPIDMAFLLITADDTPYCRADFQRDGDVDGTDLAIFAADFGRTDCFSYGNCEADFDYDGDVDGSDLAIFAADFGRVDCPCKL